MAFLTRRRILAGLGLAALVVLVFLLSAHSRCRSIWRR